MPRPYASGIFPSSMTMPIAYLPAGWQTGHSVGMTNIERIRKIRGLSQSQLADMAGTTQPHISRAEKGDDGTTLRIFQAISRALDVPLADLFTEDRSTQESLLVQAFRSLSPDRQRGWLDMARTVAADRDLDD